LIGRGELTADPRFAAREDRKRRRFELKAEIERALAVRSAQEWSALLNKSGVPAGEVLDVPAVLEHPQVVERGLLKTFDCVPAVDRPVRVVRSGFRLASGDPQPASPPPALGADTDDLLAELGFSMPEIDELARDGAI
jgi:CoA:oxalate CoA-transferase